MKLKFIADFTEIESNRAEWDSVAGSFPFFRWSWMANWFRYFGTDLRLAVLVAVDDHGKWIAIAPWCVDSTNPLATRLRFLGSGEVCSDYLDLITDEANYPEFSRLAVDWLLENIGNRETLGPIDVIELDGITTTRATTQYLCDVLDSSGLKSHTTELEGGWCINLPSTWQELNSNFSKSMRRKTKAAVKRTADPATEVISSKEVAFDELWPIFTDLHQQRRKLVGDAGCFSDPAFEQFLKSASRSLIEESKAEILVIFFEGSPLATMLCLFDNEASYSYQSGMDVDRLNLEPGYQICYTAICNAIDNGFKRFDFLRGDEPYKARWNTTRIPIYRTRFIPRTSRAGIKHGIWLAGRSLKHYLNSDSSASGS